MRCCVILCLALGLCISATLAQDSSWFPELESIGADNAARLQPLAIFIAYHSPTLSPDGHYLAMRDGRRGVVLFDTQTGQNQNYQGYHTIFSHDSSLLVISEWASRIIRLVHLQDKTIEQITVPYGSCGFFYPQEFHPSNRFLLMSTMVLGDCEHTALIDLETGEMASNYGWWLALNTFSDPGEDVEFSSDGNAVISHNYWNIRIFDTFSSDESYIEPRTEIESHCWEEPIRLIEGYFATYSDDCELIMIDPETDAIIHSFPTENQYYGPPILAYDDGILYTTSDMYDEGVRLSSFDFFTGERLTSIQLIYPSDSYRTGLVINPAHDLVVGRYQQAFSEYDTSRPFGQLLLWNAATGEGIPSLPFGAYTPVEKLWLNPNGSLLLTIGHLGYAYSVTMIWGIVEDSDYVPRLYGDVPYTPFVGLQNNHPEFNPLFNVDCPAAPPIQFTVGQAVFVPTAVETGSNRNLRLRDAPNGEQIGSLLPGDYAVIVDGPVCGDDGLRWWGVASIEDSTLRGWAVDGFAPDDYLLLLRGD